MKFEVKRSKQGNFEISKFEIINTKATRHIIALSVLAICGILILGAAVYGLVQGDFQGLKTVATYVQAPLAAIIGYYFGAKSEQKNQ